MVQRIAVVLFTVAASAIALVFAFFAAAVLLAAGALAWAWMWWRGRGLRRNAPRGERGGVVIEGEFRDETQVERLSSVNRR